MKLGAMPKTKKLSPRTRLHPRRRVSFLTDPDNDCTDYLRKILHCILTESIRQQKEFEYLQKELKKNDAKSIAERLAKNAKSELEQRQNESKEEEEEVECIPEENIAFKFSEKTIEQDFYNMYRLNIRLSELDNIHDMYKSIEREHAAGDSNTSPTFSGAMLLKRLKASERKKVCRQRSRIPVCRNKRSHRTRKHEECKEDQVSSDGKLKDVPLLAVRAYITIIKDMQQNCTLLYKSFRDLIVRPIEMSKQPLLQAAYDCWMDYMKYIKDTLNYLHPYIVSLVKTCFASSSHDAATEWYETKLPKVLINSLRNIQPWRKALRETITCCQTYTG